MKKTCFILLCLVMTASLAVMGQAPDRWHNNGQNPGNAGQAQHQQFSPEEFRARQQKFLTEKAGLSEDEAKEFFPIYFELQDKKNEINFNARQTASSRSNSEKLTDEEYTKLIDNLADAKIQIAKLEKEYLGKFKKIVPAGKVLRIQMAESQFGSELIKEMQRPMQPMMGVHGFFPWFNNGMMRPQSSFNPFGPMQQHSGHSAEPWQQRHQNSQEKK